MAGNAALLGVVVALVAAAIIHSATRDRFVRSERKLCLLGMAVWGTLALAEISLHLFGQSLWTHPANVRAPNLRVVFHPRSDIMPGVSGDAGYSTNGDGLRGPEMPPRGTGRRMICLGGSTTECTYLDDAEAWSALVANALASADGNREGHWVGAAAVSGAGTPEHLRFVETSRLMSETDTLILLCGVNDLVAALGRGAPRQAPAPWLWSKLALPKLLLITWSRWTAAARLESEDSEGRNYVARRAARASALVCDSAPSLAKPLAAYRRRLQRIADSCREHRVELVLVEQPVLWRKNLPEDIARLLWLGRSPDGRYLSVGALRQAMDAFNRVMRQVAAESGATLVDTSSLAGRQELFYDDCHLNERGASELAALVAKAMLSSAPNGMAPVPR